MSLFDILIPSAKTNYVKNPSFESWAGTATPHDWTSAGTVTISRFNGDGLDGIFGLSIIGSAAGREGVYQDIGGLTGGASYTVSCDMLGSDATDGLLVYDGGGYSNLESDYHSGSGDWEHLSVTKTAPAGGTIRLFIGATSAGVALLVADAVQLEAGTVATTFFDGDSENCIWTGTRHRSASYRPVTARNGGTWTDLDDLGVRVLTASGLGAPDTSLDIQPRAVYDGGEILEARQLNRVVNMAWLFQGTTLANLHTRRETLMSYLLAKASGKRQPVWFRYRGGANNVVFHGYVETGLGLEEKRGWKERGLIRIICEDADLEREEMASGRVTANTSLFSGTEANTLMRAAYISAAGNRWSITGGTAGLSGPVWAITPQADGDVWMGGTFATAQGVTVNGITKYNGSAFGAFSAGGSVGVNGYVSALATDGNENVIFGGSFGTAIGITTCKHIGKLSYGGTFSALRVGFNAAVQAVAIDTQDNYYAGGRFTYDSTGAGTAYPYIAKFAGNTWGTLSGGLGGTCFALAVDPSNNHLYAGGAFVWAGSAGGTVNNFARWDGTVWNACAAGLVYNGSAWVAGNAGVAGTVYALAVSKTGRVAVGGVFPTAGGTAGGTVNNLTIWNGTTYEPCKQGISGTVYGLTYDENNLLHIVGDFRDASGVPCYGYVTWNGSDYSTEGFILGTGDNGRAVAVGVNKSIYIGGDIDAGGTVAYSTSVTVSGSAKTNPLIYIDARLQVGTGIYGYVYYIENASTGAKLYLNLDVRYGEEIVIDTEKGTLKSSKGRNLDGKLLSGSSNLADFCLVPGTNYVAAVGTVAYVYLTWKEREAGV